MLFLRRARVFLLALLVVACASNDKKNQNLKPKPLEDFKATARIKSAWSMSAGEGMDKRYARFVPAITEERIYLADTEGRVFAYDRESRKRLWKTRLDVDISAGLGHADSSLYVGSYDGELLALSEEDGSVRWRVQLSSEILSVPAASSSVVVAQTIDGRLFARSVVDGSLVWRYDHPMPSLTLRGTADPLIDGNQVIACFDNGQVVALSRDQGQLLWSARVSQPTGQTELDKMVDVDADPVVSAGLVYAANYQGAVAAYAKTKGQTIWKQDSSTYRNFVIASNRLFAVTDDSHVVAFNASNGDIEWTNDGLHRRKLSAPFAVGEYLVVVDRKGYVHALNQTDGQFAARKKIGGSGFDLPLQGIDDKVLIPTNDGKLRAYTVEPR